MWKESINIPSFRSYDVREVIMENATIGKATLARKVCVIRRSSEIRTEFRRPYFRLAKRLRLT